MSIWKASPISEIPEVTLSRWSIREIDGGTLHFVGYNETEREGRVSSPIIEFDKASMKGKTRSGRVYHLMGPFGTSNEAEYVWVGWKRMNGIANEKDVTGDMI